MRLVNILLIITCFQVLASKHTFSQTFEKVNVGKIKGQNLGFSGWCDINTDGYLDIFITGVNLSAGQTDFKHSIIYLNDQNGSYQESDINNIPRVVYGSHDWGDFNNDGLPDLVISGTTSGSTSEAITKVFINNSGSFQQLPIDIPAVICSETKWIDYNNDGWSDLFIMGFNRINQYIIKIYRNNKGNSFSDSGIVFSATTGHRNNLGANSAIFEDFDNDGDKDIIIGQSSSAGYSVDLYENKNGEFFKSDIVLPQFSYATLATADFNGDGFFDVLINGITEIETIYTYGTSGHFVVLYGKGGLNFTLQEEFNNKGSYWGSMAVGDIDLDGLPDIIVNGTGNGSARTNIFINNNGQSFSERDIFTGTLLGDANLGDFDNDGDLDLLVTGSLDGSSSTAQGIIYRNTTQLINKRPSIPKDLTVRRKEGKTILSWELSNDSDTPAKSLSYNIRIGLNTNGNEIMSGMSLENGTRIIEAHGNVGMVSTIALDLPVGDYFYQIQAIDASYYESQFSEEYSFCVFTPPKVDYKTHYCHNEEVKIIAEDSVQWYADAELTNLVNSGQVFETIAKEDRTLYVAKSNGDCVSDLTTVELSVSNEPLLKLFLDDQPIEESILSLKKCDENDIFQIKVESNYPIIDWVGGNGETMTFSEEGVYIVSVSDGNDCRFRKETTVLIETLQDIFIPNIITPNGDGKNDYFSIAHPSAFDLSLSVYNRYGTELFFSPHYKGEFNGQGLSSGTYFYHIKNLDCIQDWKGWLTILK